MADKTFVSVENGGFANNTVFDPLALGGPSGYPASSADKYITESYFQDKKDALDWQDSITHGVHYIKTTTGAPIGSPAAGEKCLNTFDDLLYEESTGSWDGGSAVSTNERFCHAFTGTLTGGEAGNHTKDNKIYHYDGAAFIEIVPNDGFAALFEDEQARRTYNAGSTTWVLFDSLTSHNSISGLQGGTGGEYYHMTAAEYAGITGASPALTGSNVALGVANLLQVPVRYSFTWRAGLGQGQTRVFKGNGDIAPYYIMPKAGDIVGMAIVSSHDWSAGNATFKPRVNGTPGTLTDVLTTGNVNDQYVTQAVGVDTFAAGNKLELQAVTDGSWESTEATNLENVTVDVLVIFD